MDDDRSHAIHHIVSCSEALMHCFNPSRHRAWLRLDLTMPQLKTLLYVSQHQGATSGQIATSLGVGLSTITGIVDRLAEQNLVSRREDPRDRRVTRVQATPAGAALVDDLLKYRNEVLTAILSRLDADQLRTVETALRYLLEAVDQLELDTASHPARAIA